MQYVLELTDTELEVLYSCSKNKVRLGAALFVDTPRGRTLISREFQSLEIHNARGINQISEIGSFDSVELIPTSNNRTMFNLHRVILLPQVDTSYLNHLLQSGTFTIISGGQEFTRLRLRSYSSMVSLPHSMDFSQNFQIIGDMEFISS